MNPVLLQQQLKNNNQDVYDFCKDLKSWGEEMQKKEQKLQPTNKQAYPAKVKSAQQEHVKDKKQKDEPAKKVKKCMSYEDWEKFDAEKECELVDEGSDSELTDEIDESMKEEALVEKEKGNRFVKSGNWNEAIKCYTKAIGYFSYDPIFYANRALCYIKLKQMEKAESDCTISLKLDNTYVKAYQRRAVAREAMNRLEDAKLDLLRVLEFEPKNNETKSNLEKLRMKMQSLEPHDSTNNSRPVSKFTQSRQEKKSLTNKSTLETLTVSQKKNIDLSKPPTVWPSGDKVDLVKAIKKPPHMRSKKALLRIPIKEINSVVSVPDSSKTEKEHLSSFPKKCGTTSSIRSDDLIIVEHQTPSSITDEPINVSLTKVCREEKDVNNAMLNSNDQKSNIILSKKHTEVLLPPKNSVQFHLTWKKLKGFDDERYQYLRLIDPQNIPDIFKESFDSQTFSEILTILAEHSIKKNDKVYEYLLSFTRIKRFSALTMFFTINDKNCLWKMFNYIKENEDKSKDDVDGLISKYEL